MSYFVAQDVGTKEDCLIALVGKGYAADHILMLGDAPGDLAAAKTAGVLFYPILVGKEEISWYRFTNAAFPAFLEGGYKAGFASRVEREFICGLGG